ncbi:hypothetical protein TB1_042316 [Malus domestica]
MSEFPLDPPSSKMLFASVELGCSDEILAIIAMIQTGNTEQEKNKPRKIRREPSFFSLAVYEAWKASNFLGHGVSRILSSLGP